MVLPVTHFLYAGMSLCMLGLAFLLASSRNHRRALAVHCLFGGVALVSVAFARFWGSNEGQAMALAVMLMAVASSAAGPGSGAPASSSGGEA